jgi:hypothetical protein
MSNPLQKAVDGATNFVKNLPFEDFQLGGDNKVSMTKMAANIKKFGTVPNNAFSLEIYAAPISGDPNPRIFYTCESFSFPGRRFTTEELNTGGVAKKMPYKQEYSGEFSATFRIGKDFYERKLFEDWQSLIYDDENDVWGYAEDYMATMVVRCFDQSNQNIYGDQFFEVFPLAIEEIAVDQSNKGEPLKQSITFAYRKWNKLKDSDLLEAPSSLPFGIPLVNQFIGKDLANLITGGMNLASAVNTKMGEMDRATQQNVGFIRRAVNGQVIQAPFENIGRNLSQTLSRYSGSSFLSF